MAYLLVALFLPLRNQVRIGVVILKEPIVKRLADGFLLVVQVVDVSRAWLDSTVKVSKVKLRPGTLPMRPLEGLKVNKSNSLTFAARSSGGHL